MMIRKCNPYCKSKSSFQCKSSFQYKLWPFIDEHILTDGWICTRSDDVIHLPAVRDIQPLARQGAHPHPRCGGPSIAGHSRGHRLSLSHRTAEGHRLSQQPRMRA